MKRVIVLAGVCVLAGCGALGGSDFEAGQPETASPTAAPAQGNKGMQLGNFSISLAVKDVGVSQQFYEKLGFRKVGGDGKRMAIMQNDTSTIGLFHGMFEKNVLTFNPGWDRSCKTLPQFDDVRDIQKALKEKGITPAVAAEEGGMGPASLVVMDPDGNQILIDQHVAKPGK